MWLDIKIEGWLIIGATIVGPILAVQAQKYLERRREKMRMRQWIFHTLMASRAARLTPNHIEALNSIDIVYYGVRIMGRAYRTKTEQAVLDAWHVYHDALGNTPADQAALPAHWARRDELFYNVLSALAEERGYTFDRVMLGRGGYYPQGHGQLEEEQTDLRRLAIRVLSGELKLKMDVTSFPVDPASAERMKSLQEGLVAAFQDGTLKVDLQGAAPIADGADRQRVT